MIKFLSGIADAALSRLAPKVDAAAACYVWVNCYCSMTYRYMKKCYNCPGVPVHCGSCEYVSRC
jgi:hypothetical protein